MKGLQDRNNLLLDGRTVENKGKLILNIQKNQIIVLLKYLVPLDAIYSSYDTQGKWK